MANDSISAFYELGFERDRLFGEGEPRLELVRTLELLDRFLPPAPARLIDVGGGAGAYAAIWARRGYDVHLYDLTDLHVRQAQQASDAQPQHPFTAAVADACSVPEPDASADAVVLLGPLYHLTEQTQRDEALAEAWRILKPGGVVAAVGISRFSILLDGLWQGWLSDPLFQGIAERDLAMASTETLTRFATPTGSRPPTSTALKSSWMRSAAPASTLCLCTELKDRAG